jgi:glycosyltransferase involved in cell wall biosynthesis
MPKISVVIASYNHGQYIRQCLDSVLTQTLGDFEILLTDDGSTDDSVARIQTYTDPRIDLQVFPTNIGACVALNASIRRSRGDYVAILNSDDFFAPTKLERQAAFLDSNPNVGAVFALPSLVDEEGNIIRNHPLRDTFNRASNVSRFDWLRRFFCEANMLCHPTLLIRRACYDRVGLYNPRLAQIPDLEMWIRLCMVFEIHVLPDELTHFRVLDRSRNASAARPEVLVRGAWEMHQVLEHYLALDRASFSRVFPEHAATDNRRSVRSLVCEQALRMNTPAHSLFALDALYRELASCDDEREYAKFLRLTGQYDVYNLRIISALAAQNENLKQQLRQAKPTPAFPSMQYSFTTKLK